MGCFQNKLKKMFWSKMKKQKEQSVQIIQKPPTLTASYMKYTLSLSSNRWLKLCRETQDQIYKNPKENKRWKGLKKKEVIINEKRHPDTNWVHGKSLQIHL